MPGRASAQSALRRSPRFAGRCRPPPGELAGGRRSLACASLRLVAWAPCAMFSVHVARSATRRALPSMRNTGWGASPLSRSSPKRVAASGSSTESAVPGRTARPAVPSSLWMKWRERRGRRGARLTRRVREEYLLYSDRNATMSGAKRRGQPGWIAGRAPTGRTGPRGFHHRLFGRDASPAERRVTLSTGCYSTPM